MQKQKENLFSEKFKLLNSQGNSEDICWSSSESSDFENLSNNDRFCTLKDKHTRKRKRKKRVQKNISNLNITILDASKDSKNVPCDVNVNISNGTSTNETQERSPILASTQAFFPPFKCSKMAPTSPILTSKVMDMHKKSDLNSKSPIIAIKHASPKSSPNVRKKLFDCIQNRDRNNLEKKTPKGVSLKAEKCGNKYLDVRKNDFNTDNVNNNLRLSFRSAKIKEENSTIHSNDVVNPVSPPKETVKLEETVKIEDYSQENAKETDDSFDNPKITDLNLAKRIKSYFDSYFSSENNSQHSISESLTPKNSSKTSDEIDIISTITQINSKTQLEPEITKNISPASSGSAEISLDKSKKIRYKKHGLAYRLNALLKKQKANISLWQHERFLAENSNFIIPKGECLVFRIQKVFFKYGCYLLDVIDVNEEKFLILINNNYVTSNVISNDMIFKLYEPYKIIDFNPNSKLIINVCKFECDPFIK